MDQINLNQLVRFEIPNNPSMTLSGTSPQASPTMIHSGDPSQLEGVSIVPINRVNPSLSLKSGVSPQGPPFVITFDG